MNAFAILIHEPNPRVPEGLRRKYGSDSLYTITETTFLIRTGELAEDVAVSAGIKGPERFVTGVVFKLNKAYAGYTARSLWEWLRQAEQ